MYTCANCFKEYTSNKRYLAHIEKCKQHHKVLSSRSGKSTVSGISGISGISGMSRVSGMIDNDIQNTRIEMLTRDKNNYKDEIKKYQLKELQFKRVIQQQKDYVNNILSNRDELVDSLNEDNSKEKELLRNDLKLSNSINQKTITKLQDTIGKLEGVIEKNHVDLVNSASEIEQLKDINKRICQTLENERVENRKYSDSLRRDKEQELLVLQKEKDNIIQSLQLSVKKLEKDKEQQVKQITDGNYKYDLSCKEFENVIRKMKDNHTMDLEKLKNNHDSFMSYAKEQHSITLDSLIAKNSKENKIIEAKNLDIHKNNSHNFLKREQELLTEIENLNKKITNIEEEKSKQQKVFTKDAEIYMLSMEKKKNEEIDAIKMSMNKIYKTDIDERDNIINEIQRLNHSLGAQVGQYSSAIDNIKNETDSLKHKFIFNLNKQKEENDVYTSELEEKLKNCKVREDNLRKNFIVEINNQRCELLSNHDKVIKEYEEKNDVYKSEFEEKLKNCKVREDNLKKQFLFEVNKQRSELLSNNDQVIKEYEEKLKNAQSREDKKGLNAATELNNQRKELLSNTKKQKEEYEKIIKDLEDKIKNLQAREDDIKSQVSSQINDQRRELLSYNQKQKEEHDNIIKDFEEKLKKFKVREDSMKNQLTIEINKQRRELLDHNEKNLASYITEKEQFTSSLEKEKNNYDTKLQEITERLKLQFVSNLNKQKEEYEKIIKDLEDKLKNIKAREEKKEVQAAIELNNQRRDLLDHNEKSLAACIAEREQIKLEKIKIESLLETTKQDYIIKLKKVTDTFTSKELDLNKQIEQLVNNINRSEYIIKTIQTDFATQLVEQVSKYKDELYKLNNST